MEQDDPQFNEKRDELFEHYYPLETDPTIPFDDKFKLMDEWYGPSTGAQKRKKEKNQENKRGYSWALLTLAMLGRY